MTTPSRRPSLTPCPKGRTDYEACFAPFRYCPEKGCGRAEGGVQLPVEGDGRRPRVDYPATHEERLDRIAEMHCKQVGEGGMTSGDCNECGWLWPCPTYRWCTELVDVNCTWSLADCEMHDHTDGEPTPRGSTEAGGERD